MTKHLFLSLFAVLIFAAPALAEGEAAQISPEDIPVLDRTVGLAAAVDAYNTYCEHASDMSGDLIKKFAAQGLPPERKESLDVMKDVFYNNTLSTLKEGAKDCGEIDFLMDRLAVMKKLKAASYELHGKELPPEEEMVPGLDPLLSTGEGMPEAL